MKHQESTVLVSIDDTAPGQTPTSPSAPTFPPARNTGMFVTWAIISAFLSLLIVPEIFGSVAIILGAYTWRKEQGNRGLYIIVLGIVCMIVGLFFTSLFELEDLIPS